MGIKLRNVNSHEIRQIEQLYCMNQRRFQLQLFLKFIFRSFQLNRNIVEMKLHSVIVTFTKSSFRELQLYMKCIFVYAYAWVNLE